MSLLRKAVLVNSTEFICLGIGVLQTAVLSRVLGPAGVGQYALILSALMLAVQFSAFGFPLSFLYHSRRELDNTKAYLMNTLWFMLPLGMVGGVALAILVNYKSSYFGEVPPFALLAIWAYVPIALYSCVGRDNLFIRIEARRLSLMQLVASVGGVSLILILAFLGLLGVTEALLCFIGAMLIRAVLGFFWMRGNIDLSIRPNFKVAFKLCLMGIKLSWIDVMILVNAQISILILRHLLEDFESIGYFTRGLRVATLVIIASRAVTPMLFSRWAAIGEEQLTHHVEKVMRFASTTSIFMIAIILLCGKWVILFLYGKEFLPAVVPMMILLPGTGIYLIGKSLIVLLSSRGKPEWSASILFLSALIKAILCWVFIPSMGIKGAALASILANMGLLATSMVIVMKKYQIHPARCLWLSRNDWKGIKAQLLRN